MKVIIEEGKGLIALQKEKEKLKKREDEKREMKECLKDLKFNDSSSIPNSYLY